MNILITGGLGYVGGRLTEYFAKEENNRIFALTRGKSIPNDLSNLEILKNDDVLEKDALKDIPIDIVIHLASMNEHECADSPQQAVDVNIKGTLNWLIWARQKNVGQFIFFSTAHVYGKPLAGNLDENSKTFPQHPYAITHKAAEDYVLNFFQDHNLNTKVIRLSNSFGSPAFPTANRWTLLINDICKSIVENRSFKINSNRLQERDFISLTNVCSAVERLIYYDIPEGDNRIFNLSSEESRTLFDTGVWVKEIANNYFQQEIKYSFDPTKDQLDIPLKLSNEKLQRTGWFLNPDNDVWEIQKTFDFFLKNRT